MKNSDTFFHGGKPRGARPGNDHFIATRLMVRAKSCAARLVLRGLRLCLPLLFVGGLAAMPLAQCYQLEDIALPPGVPPEIGALAFDAKGTLYVALRRGDVIATTPGPDPKAFAWRTVATGFDNPGGIIVPRPGRIIVSQMAELTEATDTDGDGVADRYRNLASEWGLSGNYMEMNFMCDDGEGGCYLALATGSFGGPTFVHTRGEFSAPGRRGRNFSAVPYRGWVVRLRADGQMELMASGFRVPNGLTRDEEGNVWTSDNQGDWKEVTPFYHVRPGRFYGHPSSLRWDPTWPAGTDPFMKYYSDLDAYNAHRTRAAVQIPHAELARSATEPVQLPRDGAFGPFAGQMLLPDNTVNRIVRLMLEKVDGEFQGAATLFYDGMGLRVGSNRTRMAPDGGALYVGHTMRGWGKPSEGLQRMRWTGGTPFTIEKMAITPNGFRLTYTVPVGDAAGRVESYAVKSMIYQPRWTYGSAPEDGQEESVRQVVALDSRTVQLNLASLRPGRVYRLRLAGAVQSAAGETPSYRDFYYTANRVPRRE